MVMEHIQEELEEIYEVLYEIFGVEGLAEEIVSAFISYAVEFADMARNGELEGDLRDTVHAAFFAVMDTAIAVLSYRDHYKDTWGLSLHSIAINHNFRSLVGFVVTAYTSNDPNTVISALEGIERTLHRHTESDFLIDTLFLNILAFDFLKADYKASEDSKAGKSMLSFGFSSNVDLTPGSTVGLFDGSLSFASKMFDLFVPALITEAARPNNIGVGSWNKIVNNRLAEASTYGRYLKGASRALGYTALAVDPLLGLLENRNESLGVMAADFAVDTAFSFGGLFAAMGASAASKALYGMVVGPKGSAAAGIVGGFIGGVGYMVAINTVTVDDVNIQTFTKDWFRDFTGAGTQRDTSSNYDRHADAPLPQPGPPPDFRPDPNAPAAVTTPTHPMPMPTPRPR